MNFIKPEYRNHDGFTIEVIRSQRRKTAEIRVEQGAVSVRVPMRTSARVIDQFLRSRCEWIRQKVALQRQATPLNPREYITGEVFNYLGSGYRLEVESGAFAPAKLHQGCLCITVPGGCAYPHLVRNALIRWYKQRAFEMLNRKVAQLAPQVGAHPSQVEIKSFKARWGSCSSTGVVQFNWRIMLAPRRMIEYVVVHELCHLLQHNHSKAYWAEVERLMPDYRECRDWFKSNGWRLQV